MNDLQTKIGAGLLTYTFISDPSHAWLKVSIRDLDYSGVKWQISRYSYRSASHVYLEEDCDATTFVRAMEAIGHVIHIQETEVEDFDRVILDKSLRSYR